MLALDADSCPLIKPEYIFTARAYTQNRNLFFREVWREGVREVSLEGQAIWCCKAYGVVYALPTKTKLYGLLRAEPSA